jgi:hypothetical protein
VFLRRNNSASRLKTLKTNAKNQKKLANGCNFDFVLPESKNFYTKSCFFYSQPPQTQNQKIGVNPPKTVKLCFSFFQFKFR